MVRRINKKTLILAPSLTIRNQWLHRLNNDFLQGETFKEYSFSIAKPGLITFTTYQALHSFYKNDMNSDAVSLLSYFKDSEISCFVLDEAHHLQNAWWKPLFVLKDISDSDFISLTATPPYDSSPSELAKYFSLCGPIDAEIVIPELIAEGNLCPHQDYLYFSEPEEAQIQYIIEYRENLMAFVSELLEDSNFRHFLLNHPWYLKTERHLENIYGDPEFYSAILIYLNAAGASIPKNKTKLLGVEKVPEFPSFSYEWVEALLDPILIRDREYYAAHESMLLSYEKRLRKIGAWSRNRINLTGEKQLYRSLSQSGSKLESIASIAALESENLKEDLRMVVLTDYIRKEFLNVDVKSDISSINTLGVVPIFQYLRRKMEIGELALLKKSELAILSGSLLVVHESILLLLKKILIASDITYSKLYNTPYIQINGAVSSHKELITSVTDLFRKGHIKMLIGTKSFLGEGWDAPSINTLVLASFVGSFVTSNQMRGRAIRTHKTSPDKVSNIWHLVCIDHSHKEGGIDMVTMQRRFTAFAGVSLTGKPYVESGPDRLALDLQDASISKLNNRMKNLAVEREEVDKRWKEAIGNGSILVKELKLSIKSETNRPVTKKMYHRDLVKYSFVELSVLFVSILPDLFFRVIGDLLVKGVYYAIKSVALFFGLLFLPKLYKSIVLYLKYGRKDKQLYAVGLALKCAMVEEGLFFTPSEDIHVIVDQDNPTTVSCYLKGVTAKEEALFITYMEEIFSPIENPRYLIFQATWLRQKFGFASYFSVPSYFAAKKDKAHVFHKHWSKFYGKSRLLFTRNETGRMHLLKARAKHLLTEEGVKTRSYSIWK